MEKITDQMKQFSEECEGFPPIDRNLCASCGAECCDVSTPFSKDDLARIKKKSKKLLRGVKVVPGKADSFSLHRRGNTQCVFLDANKRCTIYDIRPQICKDFGDKPFAMCAYYGQDKVPEDLKTRRELAKKVQIESVEVMMKMAGIKNAGINPVDSSARNVLAQDFHAIGR